MYIENNEDLATAIRGINALEGVFDQELDIVELLEKNGMQIRPIALEQDYWVYRIVVICLGFAATFSLIGAVYLAGQSDTQIPEILTALGSAAVGALAGLLAPSP